MKISSHPHKKSKNLNFLASITIVLIISIGLISYASLPYLKSALYQNIILKTYIKSLGIANKQASPISIAASSLRNLKDLLQGNSIPLQNLKIDLKFKEFEKLRNDRTYALSKGKIQSKNLSWAKAKVSTKNKEVESKIRLKGDFLDHIATEKWSLRIKLKKDNLFGMKIFSLQGAYTRDFQTEPLIHFVMEKKGILAPRNFLSKVSINGNNINTMYVEEHFDEAMIEYGNRPYGPLLKYDELTGKHAFFDEKLFWTEDYNLKLAMLNFEDTFKREKINFKNLNSDIWAKYLAVSFVFKCFHGNLNSNLRYYFHPITKKFEPISFDNGCGQSLPARHLGFLPLDYDIVHKMLFNKKFRQKVIEELVWWKNHPEANLLLNEISEKEASLRRSLISDAPFISKYYVTIDHLDEVIKWLNAYSRSENADFAEKITLTSEQAEVLPYVSNQNGVFILNFNKFDESRFSVQEISISNGDFITALDLKDLNESKNLNEILKKEVFSDVKLNISYIDKITGTYNKATPRYSYMGNQKDIFPTLDIDKIKNYFKLDIPAREIILEKGKQIKLDHSLTMPKGFKLIFEEGSSIYFSKGAGLIVNGELSIKGSDKYPVTLNGINNEQESWSGVLVLAKDEHVNINYLRMQGGSGIFGKLRYRGAFTIHGATLKISNSSFSSNQSEDALNLVQVKGELNNIQIFDTPSDGLDIDYGDLIINKIELVNIGKNTGADAIDMSKSFVEINDSVIRNVTDKGVSIGEGSICKINEINISNALVGIASKDSSKAYVNFAQMSNIQLSSAMTYRKKSHYNGGYLNISDIETNNEGYISQENSVLQIGEVIIKTKKINIDKLYDETMLSIK